MLDKGKFADFIQLASQWGGVPTPLLLHTTVKLNI